MQRFCENSGEIRNSESMAKRRSSEIFVDEISIFLEKLENISQTLKYSEKKGEIWNRGKMHHCLSGIDASGIGVCNLASIELQAYYKKLILIIYCEK